MIKKILSIICGILFPLIAWSQTGNGLSIKLPPGTQPHPEFVMNYGIDEFVGTWQYSNNDTVFTIKLQKGAIIGGMMIEIGATPLLGGYSLEVNGVLIDNYIENIGTVWHQRKHKGPEEHVYLTALTLEYPAHALGIRFFDQRKKHLNGEGIIGGYIEMVEKGKLRWYLNERRGLDVIYEGDPDIEYPELIGFSVPTDVIMTKISDE